MLLWPFATRNECQIHMPWEEADLPRSRRWRLPYFPKEVGGPWGDPTIQEGDAGSVPPSTLAGREGVPAPWVLELHPGELKVC